MAGEATREFERWCREREAATGRWPVYAKLSDCQIIALARDLIPGLHPKTDITPQELLANVRLGGLMRVINVRIMSRPEPRHD